MSARSARQLSAFEADLGQGDVGSLPWLELPPVAGWYWYRVIPSTAVRGPVKVIGLRRRTRMLMSGRTYPAGLYIHDGWTGWKPVQHFQRAWAGPLARPVPPQEVPHAHG